MKKFRVILCSVQILNEKIIVFSSLFLNKESDAAGYDFIDKVFTVYDENTIKNQGIEINCGARSCFKCRRCYMPNPDGVKVQQIRENLK